MTFDLANISNGIGIAFNGMAIGAAFVSAIAAPNAGFDKLTGGRADTFIRELLYRTANPQAVMMLVAALAFFFGSSWVAGATALIGAFGFYSNRMMLAPKEGKLPRGAKTSRKGQRMMSVSLALMFLLIALVSIILGVIGV